MASLVIELVKWVAIFGGIAAILWQLGALRRFPGHLVIALTGFCSVVFAMQDLSVQQDADVRQEELVKNQEAVARNLDALRQELSAGLVNPIGPTEVPPLPSVKAVELAAVIGAGDGPYALALKAWAERRYDDARSLFTQAETTAIDPETLYIARADMEGYAAAYDQQIDWLEKALRLWPDDPDILHRSGNARMALRRFDEAQPYLQRAQQIWAARSDKEAGAIAQSGVACAYLQQGQPEKAKTANDAALAMLQSKFGVDDPRAALPLQNAAGIEFFRGHGREAEELLRRVLRVASKSCPGGAERAWTQNFLGTIYRKRGDFTRAEEALIEAVDLGEKCTVENGKLAEYLVSLASLYCDAGRLEDAQPRFDRALSVTKQLTGPERVDVLGTYHECLVQTGRESEASQVEAQLTILRQDAPLKGPLFLAPPPQPVS